MRLTVAGGRVLGIALGVMFFLGISRGMAQDASGATQISYEGTLDTARIGLTVVVKDGNTITGGHYFYAKYLTDIPLTGAMQASALTLKGQDGETFSLKFTGNGSEGGKPLDFSNSVGLKGTWSNGAKTLPVKLSAVGQSTVPASGRWYEMVTDKSDAAFEAMVQGFSKAVLAGDKAAAAKYVSFPLRVNQNGKHRSIHTAAELTAQWEAIFTPTYLAALKNDMPHDLSISNGQAMLGAGDVWFSDKGATALNLP